MVDAATAKTTGLTFAVPGIERPDDLVWGVTDRTVMSSDQSFVAYPRFDLGLVRIVRLSDGTHVDLGVAWIGKAQRGFAVSSDGAFEGPEEAAACAAKASGVAVKPSSGVLRSFLRK